MIEVKHDHKLTFPTIELPMIHEDEKNGYSPLKQTNIEGVLVPLIRYNNYTITFDTIIRMRLRCQTVPTINVVFMDSYGIIKTLDSPGVDSMLYLQILPPFDNAYKKIQLGFRVTNVKVNDSVISLTGRYYVPGLTDVVMKPYGFLSTYDLFEKVSNEYKLGFCSNVSGLDDERYIYNANNNVVAFLNNEIQYSGMAGGEDKDSNKHVFDWWIDFWNNINFVDVYKEYNTIVPDDELYIWTSTNKGNDANPDFTAEPYKQMAYFCNHPMVADSELFIFQYTPKTMAGSNTDVNFEVYLLNKLDRQSTLIQDGDVHENTTTGYLYGGEVFGDFDYLTKKASRSIFLNKITSQTIEVSLHRPVLGLMKGGHVNIYWFDTNNIIIDNIDTSDVESNISLPPDLEIGDDHYKINRSVSGQYYIYDIDYGYDGSRGWDVKYTLSRPADQINRKNEPSKETFMH